MMTQIREKLIGMAPTSVGPIDLLIFQPTSFCNLACKYCYLSTEKKNSKGTMSIDVIDATFRQLRASSLNLLKTDRITVVWHAGEPLAAGLQFYKNAFQRIRELTADFNLKISHSIQTNGTLINEEWVRLFREYDVHIGISVDGPEFLHNLNRVTKSGRGSFDLTVRGMKVLLENKYSFHTISVLTKESLKYPEKMFSFFENSGTSHTCFNIEEKEGENKTSSIEDNEQQVASVMDYYRQYLVNMKKTNSKVGVREFDQTKNAISRWNHLNKFIEPKAQESHPFSILTVGMKGDYATFSPELLGTELPGYGTMAFGNVLTDSIDDMLENETFKKIWKDIRAGIRRCRQNCAFYSVCGGGSPSNKFSEHGTFDATETTYCRMHKKIPVEIILEDLEVSISKKSQCAL